MSHDYDDDGCSNETAMPSGFLKLDEIEGGQINWLWAERLPVGHVTVLAGEAGSGKSMLAAEIAARVSSGTGGADAAGAKAGSVVVAHSNRHENSVLKRRLIAAGADPSKVVVFNRDIVDRNAEGWQDMTPARVLLCALEGTLLQIRDASLVVVDHLLGWLGQARLKPEELAGLFEKLAEMAARYRVGLVVLWRLEKGGRAAQTRALEALSAAAPVVWLLANDFYDPQARLAVCAQNRLGRQSENLAFRVEADRVLWQTALRWVSAEDVLAWRTADRHERRQAGQWLLDLLSQGPIEAQRLWEEARQCGLAERTIRRAAAELDLHPTKDGKSGVWLWGVRSPGEALLAVPAPRRRPSWPRQTWQPCPRLAVLRLAVLRIRRWCGWICGLTRRRTWQPCRRLAVLRIPRWRSKNCWPT